MKVHVAFLQKNLANEISEICGSDGVFILDGRNNLPTWIEDSKVRINQLKYVKPNIIGFRIKLGDRFSNSKAIYEEMM